MKIFITGGSRGIGRNLMMTALKKGHDVAFTYRNPNTDVNQILEEAKKINPEAMCRGYRLDVKDADQVTEVVDQVADDFEDIDTVVCNAGINKNNLAFSMTNEEWREVIDTNLTGTFYVIRQFLPLFLANKKGKFISVSSIAKDGMTGQANYSASKAGLIGLSAAIAKEYGPKGITSNIVVPGFFETDMTEQTMSDQLKKFWLQCCPLKRMGKLEELSEVILFLSEAPGFVNGQVLPVTGGLNWGL